MHTALVSAEPMSTHPGSGTVLNEQRVRLHRDVLVDFVFTLFVVGVGDGDDRDGRSKSGAGERPRTLKRRIREAPYVPELGALRRVGALPTDAPYTWNPRLIVDHYEGD